MCCILLMIDSLLWYGAGVVVRRANKCTGSYLDREHRGRVGKAEEEMGINHHNGFP